MRNLLDRLSQRIIKILDILVTHEDWITISELAELSDASVRTISEDIGIIRRRWGEELNIEVSQKRGIKMNNQSVAAIGHVFMHLFNDSTTLKWFQEIFFFPGNSIDFYAQRIHVSRSTLMRVFPDMNDYFKTIGIEIKRTSNQYTVIGNNETHIRQLFTCYMLEFQGLELKKWDCNVDLNLVKKTIQHILTKTFETKEFSFVFSSDIVLAHYIMHYFVSLIRENQGFHDVNYNNNMSYPITPIDDEDLACLRLLFPNITAASIHPIHGFILSQFIGWDSLEEKLLVEFQASLFYKRLFTSMPLAPKEEVRKKLEFILRSLYLTQKLNPFLNLTLFNRIRYFSMTLKKHNHSLFQCFEINLSIFSKKTGINMLTCIDYLLYWNILALPEFNLYHKTMRLLVISDFSLNHGPFIARHLKQYMEIDIPDLTIDVGAFPEILKQRDFDRYHIIITTIPNLSIDHNNIVVINDYLTERNMFELYRATRGCYK